MRVHDDDRRVTRPDVFGVFLDSGRLWQNGLIDLCGKGRHCITHIRTHNDKTYFVKRSGVIETTLPNFIHRTRRCRFIGTVGVRSNRQYRPPTDTCLSITDHGVVKEASKTDIASIRDATWCCLVNDTCPRPSSRMYLQSPLRLFARIFAVHSRVNGEHGDNKEKKRGSTDSLRYKRDVASCASRR